MPTETKRTLQGRQFTFKLAGTTFAEDLSAPQALIRANLDYEIEKHPAYFKSAPVLDSGANFFKEVKGKSVLTRRTPTGPVPMRIVSDSYTVLQNRDIAAAIDRLFPANPVSCVGDLGGIGGLFFAVRLGSFEVAQDAMEEYLLVSDRRNAREGVRLSHYVGRLACLNGLLTGRTTKWGVSIRHDRLLHVNVNRVLDALAKAGEDARKRLVQMSRTLEADLVSDLAQVYRTPEKPSLLKQFDAGSVDLSADTTLKGRIEEIRAHHERRVDEVWGSRAGVILRVQETAEEYGRSAFTTYHALNAVAEYEQHIRPARGNKSLGFSTTFGERAEIVDRAFRVLSGS